MAKDDKSFAELLKEAPKSHEADTVTLNGRLARSEDPEKFVLYIGEGQPLTVPVSAVKKHTVLGRSLGHPIVQLEIERKDLPAGRTAASAIEPLKPIATDKSPFLDLYPVFKNPQQDQVTPPDYYEGTPPDWGKPLRDKPYTDKPILDLKELNDCKPARDLPPTTTFVVTEQAEFKPIRDAHFTNQFAASPAPSKALHDAHWGLFPGIDPAQRAPFSVATPHHAPQAQLATAPVHSYPWEPIYWINHDRIIDKPVSDPGQEQQFR